MPKLKKKPDLKIDTKTLHVRPGARLSQKVLDASADDIMNLVNSGALALSMQPLVDLAKDPKHPLHGEFIWDDARAAEQQRLARARTIINSVCLRITRPDETKPLYQPITVSVKMDITVPSMAAKPTRVRVPFTRAFADEDLRAQVVKTAMKELRTWIDRYEMLNELSRTVSALRDIVRNAEENS